MTHFIRSTPLLLLLTPAVAQAQEIPGVPEGSFNVHGFRTALPSSDSAAPVGVTALSDLEAGSWAAHATTEVAAWPMIMRSPVEGGALPLVQDFVAVGVAAAISPIDGMRVGLEIPHYVASTQPIGTPQGGLTGDPRMRVVYGQTAPDNGVGGGVTGWLDIPAGTPSAYLGAPGVEGGASLLGDARVGGLHASAEVGLKRDAAVSLGGAGSAWMAGAALGWAFTDEIGISTELRADGATPSTLDPRVTPRAEIAGIGRWRIGSNVVVSAGGAAGIATQASSATRRGVVSVGWIGSETETTRSPRIARTRSPGTVGGLAARTDTAPPADQAPQTGVTVSTTWRGQAPDGMLVKTKVGDEWDVLELGGTEPVHLAVKPGENWSVRVESGGCLAGERSGVGKEGSDEVELPLMPARRGLVRYVAVSESGQPLPHATVRLEGGDEFCRTDGTLALDQGGRGSHTTGAGVYTVIATHGGHVLRQEMEVQDGFDQEVVLKFGKREDGLSAL